MFTGLHDPANQYPDINISQCVKIEGNLSAKGAATLAYYQNGDLDPALYIKIPRDPSFSGYIEREVEILNDLHANHIRDSPIRDHVPRFIGVMCIGKSCATVLSAIHGNIMSRWVENQNIETALDLAADWLAIFHKATSETSILISSKSISSLIESQKEHWDRRVNDTFLDSNHHISIETLQSQIIEKLNPLAGTRMPLSVIHGDFSAHNILCIGDKITGVIDWGEAKKRGMIFEDVFHFPFVLLTSRKFIKLRPSQYSPAKVWVQVNTQASLIRNYLHRYSQQIDIDESLMTAFIPWYFFITALKDLLPWRFNIKSANFWLDMAEASLLSPMSSLV